MKIIKTLDGTEIMVDDEDYEFLNRHNWFIKKYAITVMNNREVYMHRMIFGRVPSGCVVDHEDRNPLNNQKSNLRSATNKQNSFNKTGFNGMRKYSEFTGVKSKELNDGRVRWIATASVNGRDVHVGTCDTEIGCAWLRDAFVYALRGDFAYLNFPDNIPQYKMWESPSRLSKYL